MTERSAARLRRDADTLQIGPSRLAWHDGRLEIDIDEITAPWPTRLRGRVTLTPSVQPDGSFALDGAGRHRWSPIAPHARIDVALEQPAQRWHGTAYLDSNRGDAPLESAFSDWHWSRAALPDGRSAVLYDVARRDGTALSLGLAFDTRGGIDTFEPPPLHMLPASHWRITRSTRCDAGAQAKVLRTLEDGPFYARSLVASQWRGEPVRMVHESLSLQRFSARWVQMLLPFRMPRRGD